jgi:hypothetical protein
MLLVRSAGDFEGQTLNVLVGQGGRLHGILSCIDGHAHIRVFTTGGCQAQNGQSD